jgi:hypothetical protein
MCPDAIRVNLESCEGEVHPLGEADWHDVRVGGRSPEDWEDVRHKCAG